MSKMNLTEKDEDRPIQAVSSASAGGGICVLLRASEATKTCGRGTRENYYVLKNYEVSPPPPLKDIDIHVWMRFQHRIQSSKSVGCQYTIPAIIMVIPWTIFLCIGSSYDDAGEDVPAWCMPLFVATFILWLPTVYIAIKKGDGAALEAEERAVAKMKKTFEMQGYSTEYVKGGPCTAFAFTFVRFIRNGGQKIRPIEMGDKENQGPGAVFDQSCWAPLIGEWVSTDRSLSNKLRKWLVSVPKRNIQVSNDTDGNLIYVNSVHFRLYFGLSSRDLAEVAHGQEDNTLVFDCEKVLKHVDDAIMRIPDNEKKKCLIDARKKVVDESTFYPLGTSTCGTAAFFRSRCGDTVWKVDGSEILQYSDLLDDWLTDADIVRGCLETAHEEADSTWVKFTKVGSVHDIIAHGIQTSSFVDDAIMDLRLRPLRFKLMVTASFQVPAIVIFFVFGSFDDLPGRLRAILYLTGAFAIPNFFYSYCKCPFMKKPGWEWVPVTSSTLYLTCVGTLYIGLLASLDKWTSLWQGFEVTVCGFLGVFLLAAIANLYYTLKLQMIMRCEVSSTSPLHTPTLISSAEAESHNLRSIV